MNGDTLELLSRALTEAQVVLTRLEVNMQYGSSGTSPLAVLSRLEALEGQMNTMQVDRLLTTLDRIATDFAALNRTVEAIYEVLRDVAEHLEAEDAPDA